MTAEPHADEEQELRDLADALAAVIVAGLGPQSRFALRAALDASHTEGIKGSLILHVPGRIKDHVDCTFTTGSGDIRLL